MSPSKLIRSPPRGSPAPEPRPIETTVSLRRRIRITSSTQSIIPAFPRQQRGPLQFPQPQLEPRFVGSEIRLSVRRLYQPSYTTAGRAAPLEHVEDELQLAAGDINIQSAFEQVRRIFSQADSSEKGGPE